MQRVRVFVTALAVAASSVVMAQKVQTPEELDKTMKRIPAAHGAINKAIQAQAFADARKQLAIVQAALRDAHHFWVSQKKDDAVRLSQDAIDKAEALAKLLEAPNPDQQRVLAAFKQYAGTCSACHNLYRAQDENQQYIIKPGVL
jgi:cytochrome c556